MAEDPSGIRGREFFCSWSGGKDSCLALYRAISSGARPRCLLTILAEDGRRTMSHWLPVEFIEAQAQSLGVPLVTRSATWESYEAAFSDALAEIAAGGTKDGVFGDIDIAEHREWVERVCGSAGIAAHEPLWGGERSALLDEFIGAGFKAKIVAVRDDILGREFLGKEIDRPAIEGIAAAGADLSGERGEYHTAVTDGPIFAFPLRIEAAAEHARNGYRFLDVKVS